MVDPDRVQEAMAQIEPYELVAEVPLHTFGKRRRFLGLWRARAPEGNPLDDKGIDLFVATRGIAVDSDRDVPDVPYVLGRVVVQHTEGDQPAIMDVKVQPYSEQVILGDALPTALRAANVRRAHLPENRVNVGAAVLQDAGLQKDDTGEFLVPAVAA